MAPPDTAMRYPTTYPRAAPLLLLLLLASASLAGCGGVRQRRLRTTQDVLRAGQAIVIISTSTTDPCEGPSSYVEIVGNGNILGDHVISLNGSYEASDFSDRYGFFDAFVVQPGDYTLRAGISDVSRYYPNPSVAAFHVAAGELKYVGEVQTWGCGSFHWRMVNEWSSVRSRFVRRFPHVDVAQVTMAEHLPPQAQPRSAPPTLFPRLKLREPMAGAAATQPSATDAPAPDAATDLAAESPAPIPPATEAPGSGDVAVSASDGPPPQPSPSPPAPEEESEPLMPSWRMVPPGPLQRPWLVYKDDPIFLPLDPFRFTLGMMSGKGWLDQAAATANGIGNTGINFYVTAGLAIFDVVSVSSSFGAIFPGSGPDTSVEVTNYSLALGLRTPLLNLGLSSSHLNGTVAALSADYGWSAIGGTRRRNDCDNCTPETLDFSDGRFVRVGLDVGLIAFRWFDPGFVMNASYQKYLGGSFVTHEFRLGFAFWLL
jgi:hypothetical protein